MKTIFILLAAGFIIASCSSDRMPPGHTTEDTSYVVPQDTLYIDTLEIDSVLERDTLTY